MRSLHGGNRAATGRQQGGNRAATGRQQGGSMAAAWRQHGGNRAATGRQHGGSMAATWRLVSIHSQRKARRSRAVAWRHCTAALHSGAAWAARLEAFASEGKEPRPLVHAVGGHASVEAAHEHVRPRVREGDGPDARIPVERVHRAARVNGDDLHKLARRDREARGVLGESDLRSVARGASVRTSRHARRSRGARSRHPRAVLTGWRG